MHSNFFNTFRYSDFDYGIYKNHITNYFGQCERLIYDYFAFKIVNVYTIPPNQFDPNYRLITCGLGVEQMQIPQDMVGLITDRIEIMLTLSPHLLEQKSSFAQGGWCPAAFLQDVANAIINEEKWAAENMYILYEPTEMNPNIDGAHFFELLHYPFPAQYIALGPTTTVQILEVFPNFSME